MKKFLLCAISALMILTLGVAAANDYGYEEVGDWYVGKGFPINGTEGEIAKPIVSEAGNGVMNVATGGWYTDGASWGGIASKDLYMLDGLKVEVEFTKTSQSGDRWINIGFLEKPDIFHVSDIPSNRGYCNLIRPANEANQALNWEHIEAISEFKLMDQAVAVPFSNDMKLTMEAIKLDNGKWQFVLNGNKSHEFTNLDSIFKGDRAHIVIASSSSNAIDRDSYTYTVKVTGEKAEPLTEEEKAAWDAAAAERKAAIEAEQQKRLEELAAKRAEEEAAKQEAAKAEAEQQEVVEDEDTSADTAVVADEGNNLPIIIIVIVAVVVIVAVIAVVASKKKK